MRKLRLHSVGWLALLIWSVWGSYSCVYEVESEDLQPEETQSVGMNFSFSAHPGFEDNRASRMTGQITQQESGIGGVLPFRDIYQMKLFAYTETNQNIPDIFAQHVMTPITVTQKGSSIFSKDLANGNEKAGVLSDVSLFVGTNQCVGYAIANERSFGDLSSSVTQDKLFAEGVTLSSWNTLKEGGQQESFDLNASRLSDFYFGPKSIFPQYPGSELEKTKDAQLLLGWLNRLMEVKVNGNTWGSVQDANILKKTYSDLVKNASGAYENIRSLMESIYNRLGEIDNADTYFSLADNLRRRILEPATPTSTLGDLIFKAVASGREGEDILQLVSPSAYQFPRDLGLPDGAIILKFDEATQKFSLKDLDDSPATTDGTAKPDEFGFDGMPIQAYSYPAELLYRVYSPIKTSSTQKNVNLGSSNWETIVKAYEENSVGPNTKSAVLKLPFEYLVSCLETHAYTTSNRLEDSNSKQIDVPDGGYPVTGILVGMQRFVGWDGKIIQTPGNALLETQYLTYDRTMNTPDVRVNTNSKDTPLCYTLQLESASAKISELQDVDQGTAVGQQTRQMLVLELQNTGSDFHGHQKMLITRGMRFYLVGELNLKTAYDNDKTQYADPEKDYRIFEQGKRTRVTLKISSLAGAYNCIPDLRNPSLQIALQTDWNWQNGMIFDDNITLP